MRYAMIAILGLSLAGLTGLAGCERELSHKEEVDVKSDGTVKREQTTVKEQPDGTIVKQQTESKTETR